MYTAYKRNNANTFTKGNYDIANFMYANPRNPNQHNNQCLLVLVKIGSHRTPTPIT